MSYNHLMLWLFNRFEKFDAVGRLVLRKEKVSTKISLTRLKIIGKIGAPARCHSLQKNCLRSTCYLQVNTARCSVFDSVKIFVNWRLLIPIYKRVERSCICLVINDKKRVSLHKAGRRKDISPQFQNAIILFEDNNSRLKQTIFDKETGIVLTANTKAGKVCFNAIKRLLLQNHIISCQQDKSRKA